MITLHTNKKLFSDIIRATSQHLGINDIFIEKDYWITYVLNRLAFSKFAEIAVFKGGTSLSKAYRLIDRFSEDIDIAILADNNFSSNKIKNIIRNIVKDISVGMDEINVENTTSKGSKFRKSVFEYQTVDKKNQNNRLIIEVNSFANPYPYEKVEIKSLIAEFLIENDNQNYLSNYGLQTFKINVLNKNQTLIEKLVSLIRFSFGPNPNVEIAQKIRHFYDLYFLSRDSECKTFIKSKNFRKQFYEVLQHDKESFSEPFDWQSKQLSDSILITDFDNIWNKLCNTYKTELSALAFSEIPDENDIAKQFKQIIEYIK